ncbi:MAG TPA: beta-propeller fold lactonase family protein [Gammaproteobacteria bacterium]|nr:beta-propeller fold lactonase family protein [Gammaproteobacteria bacterium]
MNQNLAPRILSALLALAASIGTQAAAQDLRIIQTNSRDSVVHLIDPATQSIVGEIEDVPIPHGVAAAPDGSRLYISSEAKHTLDVIDGETLERIAEIPLSNRPNNISIGRDGRYVYVGIMDGDGGIDVIDTTTLENARHVDTESRVHNTYVTPDGRYFLAGTFGGDRNLKVYDAATEALAWSLFEPRNDSPLEGVRPIAFETRDDGSTSRLFVQVSEFHGFVVVDFDSGEEITRIELPEILPEQRDPGPFNAAPAHGIGVAPDGETLWVCSRLNGHVYAYSVPELEYLGGVATGSHPDWLTFSPDSRFVYVANGDSDDVSIIEIETLEEVVRLPVGRSPKRNIAAYLP